MAKFDDEDQYTVGLMLTRETRYGQEYIKVRVMIRERGKDFPRNQSWWSAWDKKPYFDGLAMGGWIHVPDDADKPCEFVRSGPVYKDLGEIGCDKAVSMAKVLTKIKKRIEDDGAHEDGDLFLAFARAVGAQWIGTPVHADYALRGRLQAGEYSEHRWAWYGLTDGRNHYRDVIRTTLAELEEARRPKPILVIEHVAEAAE